MLTRLSFLVLFCLVTSTSFAATFEGEWTGKGVIFLSKTTKENCTVDTLKIAREANELVVKGLVNCETKNQKWDYRLTINDEDLMMGEALVGHMNDEELIFHVEDATDFNWTVSFYKKENGKVFYADLLGNEGVWTMLNLDFEPKVK